MNTRQYYYLTTIAGFGNLSHAAQALRVSPSALSKFLSECERNFGSPLFLRYGRRLYPTAVGRDVINAAQRILDEQSRMLLTMKEVTGRSRQIRLATAPNRGAIIYSKIYRPFSRRYPDVALSLTELYTAEQPRAIARGQIDLALGAGPSSPGTADVPVAYEELLVSLPAAHPLAKQDAIRLQDLRDTPFVLQGPRHSIRILADSLFQAAGFQPVVAFESDDVLLVDSMLHQGVGVGLVSRVHVFPCDELVYRPLDPPVQQTLHLRYPLGHTLTQEERYLAALLVEERLTDPRYQAADTPFVRQLREEAAAPETAAGHPEGKAGAAGPTRGTAQELSLDSKVMEYLTAIVEEKSLSGAAERFFLAQSALSRYLRGVEETVGMPLFSREHNRLRPTAAGAVFVNGARNILHIEREMFARAKAYHDGRGGRFYLSCDPMFSGLLRKKVEPSFRRLHPELSFVIAEQDQAQTLEALGNSSADFGVLLSAASTHPLLQCDVLDVTELVYCFGPDGAPAGWRAGDPLPACFSPRPQLLAGKGSTLRAEQEAALARQPGTLPPAACEAGFPLLQRLANLGLTDAVLPLHLLERARHDRCAAFDPPRPLYLLLACHAARTLPPAAQDLRRIIQAELAGAMALPAAD